MRTSGSRSKSKALQPHGSIHFRSIAMQVTIKSIHGVSLIELEGSLDGKTAPEVQRQVLPGAEGQNKVILDMTRVNYISSAGLRVLLLLYRQLKAKGGKITLVG